MNPRLKSEEQKLSQLIQLADYFFKLTFCEWLLSENQNIDCLFYLFQEL